MRLKTYKMAISILPKFLTLKWNISRISWRIEVSNGSFFRIFHALSFELNFFFDQRCPLKCCKLLDKITTSLATFETLISLSIDYGSVIDGKEFHKLQTLYLQLMTHVRNIDRKMKVQTEENFQKTIMDEINGLKKALERR